MTKYEAICYLKDVKKFTCKTSYCHHECEKCLYGTAMNLAIEALENLENTVENHMKVYTKGYKAALNDVVKCIERKRDKLN